MPPLPRSDRTSYGPSRVPGVRAKCSGGHIIRSPPTSGRKRNVHIDPHADSSHGSETVDSPQPALQPVPTLEILAHQPRALSRRGACAQSLDAGDGGVAGDPGVLEENGKQVLSSPSPT